jgi:hypothetical protein
MQKQFVIIGIFVIFIFVGLSGCNQISSNINSVDDKFVGVWKGSIQGDIYSSGMFTVSITFLSDKTYTASIDSELMNMATGSGTWEMKDGKLVLTSFAGKTVGQASTYNYQFSNEENTLLLIDTNTNINMNLTKQ